MPGQGLLLEGHDDFGFALDGAGFGMVVVGEVGYAFEVSLFPPRVGFFGFSRPRYFCFAIEFIALGFPIARPGKARGLNVVALFGRLGGRESGRGVHRGWNERQGQA